MHQCINVKMYKCIQYMRKYFYIKYRWAPSLSTACFKCIVFKWLWFHFELELNLRQLCWNFAIWMFMPQSLSPKLFCTLNPELRPWT